MLQNLLTPRVFIAATRQNDGKTTTSLGLLAVTYNPLTLPTNIEA